jgi:hypothetical protein
LPQNQGCSSSKFFAWWSGSSWPWVIALPPFFTFKITILLSNTAFIVQQTLLSTHFDISNSTFYFSLYFTPLRSSKSSNQW